MEQIVRLVTAIVVFVFVLFITQLTTKFIGNYQKKSMSGQNFQMIETYRLTNNKYIQLIRIGDEYFTIAVCKDTVTMLCKVDKDSIVIPEETKGQLGITDNTITTFSEMLEKMKSKEEDKNVNDSEE